MGVLATLLLTLFQALAHEREPLKEIAGRIVQASIAKGSRDNVSALLVRLNGHC